MIKARKAGKDPSKRLSAPQHLAASVEAGVYSAVVTNPLWVVKTRMFTTRAEAQGAYRGVLHGLWTIGKTEGIPGLWKGTTLALIGISNGAIQFMTYEHLKRWGKDRKRMLRGENNPAGEVDLEPLVSSSLRDFESDAQERQNTYRVSIDSVGSRDDCDVWDSQDARARHYLPLPGDTL